MTVVAKLADLAEGRLTPSSIGRVPILLTLVNNQPVAVAARCPSSNMASPNERSKRLVPTAVSVARSSPRCVVIRLSA